MLFLRLSVALLLATSVSAQQAPSINSYIHGSWDTLQRSMTDCASFTDSKLTTGQVLYLPADAKVPEAVAAMQERCKVDVRKLPRLIRHEGDLLPKDIPTPGLLYLPNPYVVPGGRFNEMYGWDSYFILLGELADNRLDLARGTVENFFYEIDNYGAILNANRTYYLTRSQPPFLSSMVLDVYRAQLKLDPTAAKAFLKKALPYLLKDHGLWTSAPHLAGDTGLSRYFDLGSGPVPEMQDDSAYYGDVIAALLKNGDTTFLEEVPPTTPCKPTLPIPCAKSKNGKAYELIPDFFIGDRATRESGFDTSFRFGPFGGTTQNFIPVCLNSLLFKYERDIAYASIVLGDKDAAIQWSSTAGLRLQKMNELLWDETSGLFFDYDYVNAQPSIYPYLTMYYTLWAGVATPEQAKRMASKLSLFERPGGLTMSTQATGLQWDEPFGWAPTNWLAIDGLHRYGFNDDAGRIAHNFSRTIGDNFAHDGTIREKYNVESADANVAVSAGYKTNVVGFGWTNGVYLKMQQLLSHK